jgi:hypothetical protein
MQYRYQLPKLLLFGPTVIIAMLGQNALPFTIEDITEFYQTDGGYFPITAM